MGYGAYLKSLLAPLDLYDLEKGIGAAELESIGGAMDGVYETLTELERDDMKKSCPITPRRLHRKNAGRR